jgi:hypothetical protein
MEATMMHLTVKRQYAQTRAARHSGIGRAIAGFISLLIGSLLLLTSGAFAQEFRATISGTISDTTGALIPSAIIVVTETQSGTVNRTTSDRAGQYVVPFLPPGEYSITVTKSGFETLTRAGITLQAQEHPVINLTLIIGSSSQTVTVTAEAPLINLDNASVGDVISTQSVADLPLNGRTPVVLTELSVGVITTSAPGITHPFDNNAANSWSISGTPNQVSEVLLDGSPDLTMLGAQAYSPTQDTVQEVSVQPFATDASFGHTIGGVINQVTKGGTNAIHGTMYEFNQIPNLNANLYFNSAYYNKGAAKPLPTFHYNQYGLSVGGPVLIPKLFNGKNKLFFFFAWEGLKDNTPASQFVTVPTDAEKNGDFSALLALGATYQLYEPNTGTLGGGGAFTRTKVPSNCLTAAATAADPAGCPTNAGLTINPVAAAYMKLYPEPNATGSNTGANNYNSNAPSIDNYNNEFGRLDYNVSDRNHVFFDYRHNYRTQIKNNYLGNDTTGTTLLRENFGSTLDDVISMNSSTVFDVRLNWTFFNEVHGALSQAFSPASVGLPSGLQSNSTEVQLPFISMGTCGSFTSFLCLGDTSSAIDPTTSYQVFADVVKLTGKHTLKAGFDGRQYRLRVQNFGDSSGSFTFASTFMTSGSSGIAQPFGGDLASMLLGYPTAGEYDINTRADYRAYYIGAFLQDDWRVSNHLTVNLGVRFDIDTPYGEKLGRTVNGFDPLAVNSASAAAAAAFNPANAKGTSNGTTVSVSSINTLGGLTFPSSNWGAPYQIQDSKGFWSPRIGFSYNPAFLKGKLVIRGGFGVFVQPETLASLAATGSYSSNAINDQEGFSAPTTYVAATDTTNFKTANTLSNPFPNGFAQPAGSSGGASTFLGSTGTVSFLAPVEHDPYSERWNLGVQHELTGSTLIEVLYVGNHAVHLPVNTQNINTVEQQYLTTNPYRDYNLVTALATKVNNPFSGLLPGSSFNAATTALSGLTVPYPQFGTSSVNEQNETIGQSWFHSGMVHVQQRAKHGLTLTANYSFSKLLEKDTRLNDVDVQLTRRVSPYDHRQHFTVGGTYDLPFGRGKLFTLGGGKLADEIFGGWVINSIYQFQTGPPIYFSADIPFNPGNGVYNIVSQPRNTSLANGPDGTPAVVNAYQVFATGAGTCTVVAGSQPCDGTVSTYNPNAVPTGSQTKADAVAASTNASYANHYRTLPQTFGSVRADGFNNMDASILKNFKIVDRVSFQLRFETFDTLNHAFFAAPAVTSATSSSFGYVSAVPSTAQPRQIQLGGRITF